MGQAAPHADARVVELRQHGVAHIREGNGLAPGRGPEAAHVLLQQPPRRRAVVGGHDVAQHHIALFFNQ